MDRRPRNGPPRRSWRALAPFAFAPGLLALAPLAADSPQQAPAAGPTLLVYPGDLTLIEEIEPVVLPAGRSSVRLDFVRGNADVNSLEVTPLDRPAEVKAVGLFRRDDLGNTTFVEIDAAKGGPERLRLRYAARGLAAGVAYLATFDASKWTLDLAQELEVTNGSGESFEQAEVRAVFGDVHTVASTAVLNGRSADAAPDAPAGLPPAPLRQDLAEHTIVPFGAPLRLPDGVTIRRRVLEKRDLPAKLEWHFDANAWGGRVWRVAKVANSAEGGGAGLGGVTLQPGGLLLHEREATATERFLRGGALGHLAPGQELELDLGPSNDLAVERTQLDFQRTDLVFGDYNKALVSYSEEETWKLEIASRVGDARTLVIDEHVATPSFEVVQSSAPAARKDQTTLEWKLEIPARAKVELTYKLRKTNLHP